MYSVWDQLALSEPAWHDPEDAVLFTLYRNQQRLVQFLMALTSSFEPVCASLLHRHPLPTLEQAISELLSEETRLGTLQTHHVDSDCFRNPSRSSSNSHSSRGGSSRGSFHRSGNQSHHTAATASGSQSHHTAAVASGNQSHHTDTTSAGFSESPAPSTPRFSLTDDPQTGQTIGIGRKHRRLYELIYLHVPDSPQIAAPASTSSKALCSMV
ncbi:uncharacterized protein LOC114311927 [Camellia sinensis]|uniref:uncharacterized protein LOC114311927 n=1 Tax=Camellia sinensis TaxID=4442 RepID=UPI001035E1A6|nr:uncharacterized protein LOC114311927 [Camellia sinensis]